MAARVRLDWVVPSRSRCPEPANRRAHEIRQLFAMLEVTASRDETGACGESVFFNTPLHGTPFKKGIDQQ